MATESTPEFSEYVAVIRRHSLLIAWVVVPIVVAALVIAVALPDVYESRAVMSIEQQQAADYLPRTGNADAFIEDYVNRLTDTVLSSPELRDAIKEFEPYPDLRDEVGAAAAELRSDVRVAMVTTQVLDPGSGRERETITGFTVSYSNASPKAARDVATWLAEAYLTAHRTNRQRQAVDASKFLATEAEKVRLEIAAHETRLAEFKRRNFDKLPEQTQLNQHLMDRTERELEGVELQIRTLDQNRIFLVHQIREAETANPEAGRTLRELEDEYRRKVAIYDANHPDIITLRRQIERLRLGAGADGDMSPQAQLETQRAVLAETRQRYSDDHPDVKRLLRSIELLEAQVAANAGARSSVAMMTPAVLQLQTQLNALDNERAALKARSDELRSRLLDMQGRLVSSPEVERAYKDIARDVDVAREKYNELLKRQMDADVSASAFASGAADDFRLMHPPAEPRSPSEPNRIAIVVIGFILAFALAATATVMAEGMDAHVRGSRDVQRILSLSPLAVIPEIRHSVTRRRRFWRVAALLGCVLVGAPLFYYFAVRTFA